MWVIRLLASLVLVFGRLVQIGEKVAVTFFYIDHAGRVMTGLVSNSNSDLEINPMDLNPSFSGYFLETQL